MTQLFKQIKTFLSNKNYKEGSPVDIWFSNGPYHFDYWAPLDKSTSTIQGHVFMTDILTQMMINEENIYDYNQIQTLLTCSSLIIYFFEYGLDHYNKEMENKTK